MMTMTEATLLYIGGGSLERLTLQVLHRDLFLSIPSSHFKHTFAEVAKRSLRRHLLRGTLTALSLPP